MPIKASSSDDNLKVKDIKKQMIYDIWKCKKLYGFHYMEAALKVTRISGEIVDSRHYTKLAWGLLHLKQRFQRLMRQ